MSFEILKWEFQLTLKQLLSADLTMKFETWDSDLIINFQRMDYGVLTANMSNKRPLIGHILDSQHTWP